jgi:sugar lactone lactonase YvrE
MSKKASAPVLLALLAVTLVLPIAAVSAAPGSSATTFVASLSAAPGVTTAATGVATFELAPNGTALTFNLTVSDLSNAFMAHIHLSPSMAILTWLYPNPNVISSGEEGNCLLVIMGGSMSQCPWIKSGAFTGTLAQGTITAADLSGNKTCYGCVGATFGQLIDALESGHAFVNVHTAQNPAGEIMGTIEPVTPKSMTSPVLTIAAVDGTGGTIPGYYTVLTAANGTVDTGFSPQAFSLDSNQTYSVGVENYGQCSFAAWGDGITANPRSISISTNVELTAIYNCGNTGSAQSTLTVMAVDQNGNPLPGYFTTLWQGGQQLQSRFTPATFTGLSAGQGYSILADNFGGCSFVQWSGGSPVMPAAFVAPAGVSSNLTAIYNCTPTGTSTVNVSTMNTGGNPQSGFYMTLWQNSSPVQSCFSPCSFTVQNGMGYQVSAADYGQSAFNHWSDGTPNRFYPLVIPSESITISILAIYNQVGVLSNFVTNPVAGLTAEGIVHRGQTFYVSTIGFTAADGTIFAFDGKGDLTGSYTLAGLPVVGQATIYGADLFVVACPATLSSGAVAKIDLTTGAVNPAFAIIPVGCPNGLAMDAHGNLYVADFAGSIYKVTQSGLVTLWATGGLLTASSLDGFTIGPNDLTYDQQQDALYTTNTGSNTVVEIPINQNGSAGAMSAYATVPGPDGLLFDAHGDLYVASPFTNTIFVVSPGGSSVSPLNFTGTETLDAPSAVLLVGNNLYITNSNSANSHSSGYVAVTAVRYPGG